MANTIKKKTGAESIRWDLKDLYSKLDDPKITKDLMTALTKAKNFQKKYKGKIQSLSSEEMALAYKELELLMTPVYKAGQYASLVLSIDTTDENAKSLDAKIDDVSSELSNFILFFDLEIGKLSKTTVDAHLKNTSLKNYAYALEHSFKTSKHNLSEKEEQVINLKDLSGVNAFQKLYEELTSSFEYDFKLDGKLQKMNGSQLRALRQHKDPKVRKDAMALFFSRYEENKLVLTTCFNSIFKDYATEKKLRQYKTAISRRNTSHDLPDDVVSVLHEVTTESNALVRRYYKLKQKMLGLKKMTLADIYAPLPSGAQTFSYDEAKTMVLDGFKSFDKEFYDMAKRMFDDNRIDAPVEAKKRGGAFCSSSSPDIDPYVLLNFLGRPRDVSTMAHELGHAIHDMLCADQTLFNYHPILPLAETASVFSEMIITDRLKKTITDPVSRQALLTEKLEDIFATSHRQNMFSRFEQIAHEKISENILSTDEFCNIYQDELKNMFGDVVEQPEEYKWEWSAIPHMVAYPFYVYAYNFGNLLVMALYQSYLDEGQAFVPKLKTLLSAGSAESPMDITQKIGIDISKKSFWQKSLKFIENMIDELEDSLK